MAEAVTSQAPVATPAPASATQPGAAPTTAPVTKAEAVRMLKLKVDGAELELPENEVISLAQQGKAAGKRFQEAAQTRTQAEQIIKFAKENPTEFFKKTGMNARQWAEEFLLGEIQREQMSPEQKLAYEQKQQLEQYKAREKQAKEAAERQKMSQLEQQHMQTYDKMFTEALTHLGLPKTAYSVKRMAELERVNLKKNLNLPAEKLAQLVKEDYIAEHKALLNGFEGDELLEFLGKEAVKKLSKAQLAKYKGKAATPAVRRASDSEPARVPNKVDAWKAMKKKTRSLF